MPIRHGGRATPHGFQFELTGGRLCLDFANTLDNRPTDHPQERLATYADLISWSVQAGALQPPAARRLEALAARRAREAAELLGRARDLREAIFAVLSGHAAGRPAPAGALEVLQAALPGAMSRLRLAPGKTGFAWGWDADAEALDAMLWPVVRSATDLLTSDDLDRVRVCAGQCCNWLFLDQSRNRSRRWCDMTVCGNRDKARRFYRRARASA
jgi:predicted RNA-binding Zn ribbon-like protein